MEIERKLMIAEALREALEEEMERDERVILIGEDVGRFGGGFQVTHGLLDKFGPQRVIDTPISETGFVGAAVGAAMTGLRPVVDVMYSDFLTCCMEPIAIEAAKIGFMSGGQFSVPMVIRSATGASHHGATHGQSLEAWFMHVPGLKVVAPSTSYDAKGLLKSAIRDDHPVMFFEHKQLYGSRPVGGKNPISLLDELPGVVVHVPEGEYLVPLGKAAVRAEGRDVTVVSYTLMAHRALQAAESLAAEGISVEVIDLRTLVPLDIETILKSVEKTGRLVVVSEDCLTGSVASEISACVAEKAFDVLRAPILRVCGADTPLPFAPATQGRIIPNQHSIAAAIRSLLNRGGQA